MGVPVAGGFRKKELTGDPRDERHRTSAWIQTRENSILIDIGPEFRMQTLRAGLTRVDLLLITHEHTDHIGGLDDLRPFNYRQNQTIPVYTLPRSMEAIRKRFDYMFEPGKTPGSVDIDMQELNQTVQFRDCEITPLPVYHGNMEVMGFRVNDVSYVTDVNHIPEETARLIEGSRVLVLSGLRWEPSHPTHFTIPEAIEQSRKMNVEQTYLVHMSSHVKHETVSRCLPDDVLLAYDQLSVDIATES